MAVSERGIGFRLTRHFSLIMLAATVAVTALVVLFNRDIALTHLKELGESRNVTLAQAFANSIWPRFAAHVTTATDTTAETLRAHPQTAALERDLIALKGDLPVLKVKIYNRVGTTIYSSDPTQIGEDKSDNPGFIGASDGTVRSELTHRGRFDTFEHSLYEVDVLSSYVPVREADGRVDAVLEVYTDVTPLVNRMERVQLGLMAGLVFAFGALYGVSFLVVRRGDRVLRRQHTALLANEHAMEAKADEMAAEIRRRTVAEQEARAARQQAEAANGSKSEFLANMSHELRTPLNAVIGFAEVIEKQLFGPVGSARYVAYASDIRDSGTHLLDIINDILDLSKVEAGRLELNEEDCDVAAIAASAVRLVQDRADRAGLRLEANLPLDLPRLRADSRAIKQILLNLLTNAVKYTPAGGRVAVAAALDEGGLALGVADTGIGMASEDIPRALAAFGQIDNALNRKHEGTGLGLPLVKALTEAHGGRLELESEIGVGTTATVRLPRDRVLGAGLAA